MVVEAAVLGRKPGWRLAREDTRLYTTRPIPAKVSYRKTRSSRVTSRAPVHFVKLLLIHPVRDADAVWAAAAVLESLWA
jgi:hypothetical protein